MVSTLKLSIVNAVTHFMSDFIRATENDKYSISVLMDLSKAFDTIYHKQLEFYGIRWLALEWFRCYLKGRTQYVSFKNVNANHIHVSCGVPQGMCAWPTVVHYTLMISLTQYRIIVAYFLPMIPQSTNLHRISKIS